MRAFRIKWTTSNGDVTYAKGGIWAFTSKESGAKIWMKENFVKSYLAQYRANRYFTAPAAGQRLQWQTETLFRELTVEIIDIVPTQTVSVGDFLE